MVKIKGKILVKTPLHIGGADDTMKIGGVDSPVIKREIKWNKKTKKIDYQNGEFLVEPYIPGSSLKGKIRSLLEHHFGLHKALLNIYQTSKEKDLYDLLGKPINSKHLKYLNEKEKKYAQLIIKLFGESAGANNKKEITIPSFVFRDCFITPQIREKVLNDELELTEEKFENVINRISGKAEGGGLRQIERVVAGVEFDFNLIIRNLNDLNENLAKNTLLLGLKLLENDYLGGNGTRGYGEIKFLEIENLDELSIEELNKAIDESL